MEATLKLSAYEITGIWHLLTILMKPLNILYSEDYLASINLSKGRKVLVSGISYLVECYVSAGSLICWHLF